MNLMHNAVLFVVSFAAIYAAMQWGIASWEWWRYRQPRTRRPSPDEKTVVAHVAAQLRAGAQAIAVHHGIDPSQIPDDAKSVRWESCHLFSPYGKRPERTVFGLHVSEPPLAMTCVECDLRQPVLHYGARRCAYCGTVIMVHGTRVYFWRDKAVEVEEWRA